MRRARSFVLSTSAKWNARIFFCGRLKARFGLDAIAPVGADAQCIDEVITRELVLGRFEDASRKAYAEVIARLVDEGPTASSWVAPKSRCS